MQARSCYIDFRELFDDIIRLVWYIYIYKHILSNISNIKKKKKK